jgi:DNA-binding response OmpR family regulator
MISVSAHPILVVDDEQSIRLGFSVALRSSGFDVEVAATGAEAIERAPALSPDCVLLDLRMPGLDGLQTAAALRENGYEGPIILASAFADHSTAVMAIGEGITDFLTKPIKPTELRYAVNHAISRHVRFENAASATPEEIPAGLRRAYAKYCLSRRRMADAKAMLLLLTTESHDLQSLLLLGALYELDGKPDLAAGLFVRATELHSHVTPIATSNALFTVFSHSESAQTD